MCMSNKYNATVQSNKAKLFKNDRVTMAKPRERTSRRADPAAANSMYLFVTEVHLKVICLITKMYAP